MVLGSLTPELIGLILSYKCVLSSAIPLWLTGNKQLQRQLAQGVTDVRLKSTSPKSLCCFPSCLKELRHLRTLIVNREGNRILFPSSATSTIRSLSPTLKKLSLSFHGSAPILFGLTQDAGAFSAQILNFMAAYLFIPPSSWSFKAAFPQLESLGLNGAPWSAAMVAHLPTSLTSIKDIVQDDLPTFTAFVQALPPQIQHLDFIRIPRTLPQPSFLALFSARNLLTLKWYLSDALSHLSDVSLLPRTLTELPSSNLNDPSQLLAQEAIDALPPALTRLPCLADWHSDLSFAHLKDLESLGDTDWVQPGPPLSVAAIKRLPANLRCLNLQSDLAGMTRSDWPPLLTKLEWQPSVSLEAVFSLQELPPRLVTLSILEEFQVPSKMIGLLPRTLRTLRMYCFPFEHGVDIDFPPNLTLLNLDTVDNNWLVVEPMVVKDRSKPTQIRTVKFRIGKTSHVDALETAPKVVSSFPLHCIPRTLVDLRLPCCIHASQLLDLPPRLQQLDVHEILIDADFDANDPLLLPKMSALYDVGLKQDDIVTPASYLSLPASGASLLPRSLRIIECQSSHFWRRCDWRRLPPNLEMISASLSQCTVSATLFKEATFPRLSILHLLLHGLTDELVKLMPRSLASLADADLDSPEQSLTLACVPYWPSLVYPYGFSHELLEAFDALQEKRTEAIANSNIEDLRALFPHSIYSKLYAE